MAADLPTGLRIDVTPVMYQAECEGCGWHTRQLSGGQAHAEVTRLANNHYSACSHPVAPPGACCFKHNDLCSDLAHVCCPECPIWIAEMEDE